MPLICSYDSSGQISGIVAAAPTFYYLDVAYSEQQIKEQWNCVLQLESESITFPWAVAQARLNWEMYRPWSGSIPCLTSSGRTRLSGLPGLAPNKA
jgi:hypothetical protein